MPNLMQDLGTKIGGEFKTHRLRIENVESTKVNKVTSTDNAIVRFDGTTGEVQNSGVIIDDTNNVGVGIVNPIDGNIHIHTGANSNIKFTNSTTGTTASDGLFVGIDSAGDAYVFNKEAKTLSLGTNNLHRMIIDSTGNVGIGGTPSAWSGFKALQQQNTSISSNLNEQYITSNGYYNGSNWIYNSNTGASQYLNNQGGHTWKTAPSGTAGNPITWTNAMSLDAGGNLLLQSGTGALGYGTGAGGVVTQLTSKLTAVTLNKPTGTIIMSSNTMSAGTVVGFNLINSLISYNDTIIVNINNINGAAYNIWATSGNSGFSFIRVKNISAGSLSDALPIQFSIIKGAQS